MKLTVFIYCVFFALLGIYNGKQHVWTFTDSYTIVFYTVIAWIIAYALCVYLDIKQED